MSVAMDQCTAPEVICIGEALLDRLGPLGGDPILDKPIEDCLGGAPANVACGLAKLGTKVAFCGRLGDDAIGKKFQKLFDIRGVNLRGLQIDQARSSRIVLVRRDLSGDRSFQGFQGDATKDFADQALAVNDLIEVWPFLVRRTSWLLSGTIPLATSSSAEALEWAIDEALRNDIKLALDINWRSTFWNSRNASDSGPNKAALIKIEPCLEKASLLKLAKEEAMWFFNTKDPCQISKLLPNHPDVVVTDGPLPVHWFIEGFNGETKALSPPCVVDTTGAGDAFMAGLIHQLLMLSSMPIKEELVRDAVLFAAACGALVCGGAGAIDPQPTYEEVEAFLFGDGGGNN